MKTKLGLFLYLVLMNQAYAAFTCPALQSATTACGNLQGGPFGWHGETFGDWNPCSGNFQLKIGRPDTLLVYNSKDTTDRGYGKGWRINLPMVTRNMSFVPTLVMGDGAPIPFASAIAAVGSETRAADPRMSDSRLFLAASNKIVEIMADGTQYVYENITGASTDQFFLVGIWVLADNSNNLTKTTTVTWENGRLTNITDEADTYLNVLYNVTPYRFYLRGGGTYQITVDDGQLIQMTRPDSMVMTFTYNAQDRIEKMNWEDGAATTLCYNTDGSLRELNTPAGGLKMAYNSTTTVYSDSLKTKISQTYANGKVTQITSQDGGSVSIARTGMTQEIYTDHLGQSTKLDWDTYGNLTKVTDSANKETQLQYGTFPNRNLKKIIYPNSIGMRLFTYLKTTDNRVKEIYAPSGDVTTFTWEGSKLLEIDDPTFTKTFTYQAGKTLAASETFNDKIMKRVATLNYDTRERVSSINDPFGRTVSFNYHGVWDLVTHIFSPDGTNTTIVYGNDRHARQVTQSKPGGATETAAFSWLNFPTQFQTTYQASGASAPMVVETELDPATQQVMEQTVNNVPIVTSGIVQQYPAPPEP